MRIILVIFFAGIVTAQSLTVGAEGNILGGMSYRFPAVGGFARVERVGNGLNVWNTAEVSNDRKTYETDGWYLQNTAEVGWRVGRLVPEAVVFYGRQSNSQYTKAMASVGGGLRYALDPRINVYGQYLAPDMLSFNRAQRFIGGSDMRIGRRMYVGMQGSMISFFQPGRGRLMGMEISGRFGFTMGGKSE
jgi:hypothetical protein